MVSDGRKSNGMREMLKQAENLISVIVPMYNSEKTIERCVKSIQCSSYEKIEIILVDDGSKDNTVEICRKMQENDSRIEIYIKENSGAGETRSYGLRKASGNYVAFVDSDDWIEADMYEKLYRRIIKDKLDVCFCGYYFWGYRKNRREEPMRFRKSIYKRDEMLKEVIHNTVWFPSSTMQKSSLVGVWRALYSAKIIRDKGIKFLSERKFYSEDSLFNLEFLSYTTRIGFVRECYYNYMSAEGTLTTTCDSRYEKMNEWYSYVYEFSKKHGISRFVIPYLNTQYLKEFQKNINQSITEEKSENLTKKYALIKERYKYLKKIRILKMRGCSFKEKVKLSLLVYCKSLYVILTKI